MKTLQAKAPQINGWIVYMGATDRNMVLLQPDFDIPTNEDWVLLDSMWRTNEYEYDLDNLDRIAKRINDEKPIKIDFCIPIWLWLLPLFLLCCVVFLQISNFLSNFCIDDNLQNELGLINAAHLNGVPINITKINEKKHREFAVGTDFYFYPSPAIPPPKYNEIDEALLLGSSDDEHDTVTLAANTILNQKQNEALVITAKKDKDNGNKTNNVVDI